MYVVTMRLYDRSSRTVDLADVDPALRAAILEHAEQRLLGAVEPVAITGPPKRGRTLLSTRLADVSAVDG